MNVSGPGDDIRAGGEGSGAVLRRKLEAARENKADGGPGADRSWRIALARAARDTLKLPLEVTSLTLARRSLSELLELPPERALIAVLEGPGDGLGVLVLSPEVLSGFVESLAMGRITPGPVLARRPTRTDAAMVAATLDEALVGLERTLADEADLIWAGGFRYASFLDDPRPLALLLDDIAYRVMRCEVSLARGARTGMVMLALPAEGQGKAPRGAAVARTPIDHGPAFAEALSSRVAEADCVLVAVLARLTLPLASVMDLEEGQVLALPQAALDRISVEGVDGRAVVGGTLGQNRGMRAVRLADADRVAPDGDSPEVPGMMGENDAAPLDFGFAPDFDQDEAFLKPTGTG